MPYCARTPLMLGQSWHIMAFMIFCLAWAGGCKHYSDIIMDTMASEITSLTIVFSIVYSGTGQRKHQSSASLAFVWGIHRWPVNSPHKWPVTRKMFLFEDVIMSLIGNISINMCHNVPEPPGCFCSSIQLIVAHYGRFYSHNIFFIPW